MRIIVLAIALSMLAISLPAQENSQVSIIAILVDEQLDQKPVPRLLLVVRPETEEWKSEVRTAFDGKTKIDLPPGRYMVSSPSAVRLANAEYTWSLTIDVPGTRELVLSNDNATVRQLDPPPAQALAPKTAKELFPLLKDSVVTVWSEFGHGTGFFVDTAGLVLTNEHVVGSSTYLAVQSDPQHKIAAKLIEQDSTSDLAVLWVAPSALPSIKPVQVANVHDTKPDLVEGDQVFTIGSPLNQRKIITSGIASKIEEGVIISDININPGNSGGPLFNDRGEVVGVTTFGDATRSGPGVSGVVRIEAAIRLIESARVKIGSNAPPPIEMLPVEPEQTFPPALLKVAAQTGGAAPYYFNSGDYSLQIITPVSKYREQNESRMAAVKEKERRTAKAPDPVRATFEPLADLPSWAAYAGELQPVLQIRVQPRLKETVGSAIGRGLLAAAAGYSGTATRLPAAKMRFRSDFYRMDLFCNGTLIQPIHPARYEMVIDEQNGAYNVTDATYGGFYTYPYDAIGSSCSSAFLRVYSEAKPTEPKIVSLSQKILNHVTKDFSGYDRMVKFSVPPITANALGSSQTTTLTGITASASTGETDGGMDDAQARRLLDQISFGMSKDDVLRIVGQPDVTETVQNSEVWKYRTGSRFLIFAFVDSRVSNKAMTY